MQYEITWRSADDQHGYVVQEERKAPPRKMHEPLGEFYMRCVLFVLSKQPPQVQKTGQVNLRLFHYDTLYSRA